MTITVTPTPPVTPPTSVTICLDEASLPGTVTIRADPANSVNPSTLNLTLKQPCGEVKIYANAKGVVAEHKGSAAVNIV